MTTPSAHESEQVLSTLRADGTRRWLNPKPSPGRWLNRRRVVGYGLIALFVSLPHLRLAGKPPLLLDIVHREFTFFGVTLYPTDTYLFALLMLIVFLGLFFLTALFGRIWCGWACPQTVYMELVFRPIERFFHGAPGKKKKTGSWRTPAKMGVYALLAFVLAHTFLSYFVGTDALREWMTRSPLDHPLSFLLVAGVTGLMLFDFGFFREQMCIVACPYGRMQSVMLDRDSLVIGYDRARGEPRGKLRRAKKDVSLTTLPDEQGDCIDCKMCVTTCPTGIDIRDGLQMECVNCTQCIDACDTVMDKIGKPRGLIRYSSQRALEGDPAHKIRPRMLVYPLIIAGLLTLLVTALAGREPVDVSINRGPGMPYQLLEGDRVGNLVKVKLQTRGQEGGAYTVSVEIDGFDALVTGSPNPVVVPAGELATTSLMISVPAAAFVNQRAAISVVVTDETGERFETPYRLIGPTRSTGAAP